MSSPEVRHFIHLVITCREFTFNGCRPSRWDETRVTAKAEREDAACKKYCRLIVPITFGWLLLYGPLECFLLVTWHLVCTRSSVNISVSLSTSRETGRRDHLVLIITVNLCYYLPLFTGSKIRSGKGCFQHSKITCISLYFMFFPLSKLSAEMIWGSDVLETVWQQICILMSLNLEQSTKLCCEYEVMQV